MTRNEAKRLIDNIYDEFALAMEQTRSSIFKELDKELPDEGAGWVKKQYIKSSIEEYHDTLYKAIDNTPNEKLSKSE